MLSWRALKYQDEPCLAARVHVSGEPLTIVLNDGLLVGRPTSRSGFMRARALDVDAEVLRDDLIPCPPAISSARLSSAVEIWLLRWAPRGLERKPA